MKGLLTGASGFLGSRIQSKFQDTQVAMLTLGRGTQASVSVDLAHQVPILPPVDRVIHVAGKAHLYPKTEAEKKEFFQVNEGGTTHLCQGLEASGSLPKQVVFISTVAVYGKEVGQGIREEEPLRGASPYALSKIRAEHFLQDWGKTHGVKILILRLPLIAGTNPPGNLGKMIHGIRTGRYLSIGGGLAQKSMVLADDVAELILRAEEAEGIYNLTDGYHPCFYESERVISNQFGKAAPRSIPLGVAKIMGKVGDWIPGFPVNSQTIAKITLPFTFDDSRARRDLGWKPRRVLDHLFE